MITLVRRHSRVALLVVGAALGALGVALLKLGHDVWGGVVLSGAVLTSVAAGAVELRQQFLLPSPRRFQRLKRAGLVVVAMGAAVVVTLFAVSALIYVTSPNAVNFLTLSKDLARIHLPHSYQVSATRELTHGQGCRHGSCELEQTWTNTSSLPATTAQACAAAKSSMRQAYPDADSNDPVPSSYHCQCFTILTAFFRPQYGKRFVEAHVPTGGPADQIVLTASYGSYHI